MMVPLLFCDGAYSEKIAPEVDIKVINPDRGPGGDCGVRWASIINRNSLYEWGRGRGLYLVPDAPPAVDDYAGMIHRYGTRIAFEGLNPSKSYYLHADFVQWRVEAGTKPAEILRISSVENGVSALIAEVRSSDLAPGESFCIAVPYRFTVKGRIDLLFRETGARPGVWGMWDIILSESEKKPETIPESERKKGRFIFK